jgi:MFS family permease
MASGRSRKGDEPTDSLLRPLASRNFTLVWISQSISSLGNGIYTLTLGWTTYQLTRSAVLMGTVLAVNIIPQLVLMLMGGVLADRYRRRTVIMACDGVAAMITGWLAVSGLLHLLFPAELVVASLLLGAVISFFTPAYSAINRDLVATDDLRAANALRASARSVAKICGPAVGGLTYAAGGAALGFGVDAASFLIAAVAVIFVDTPKTTVSFRGALRKEVTAGISYVVRTRWLRAVILISLLANTVCLAPFSVLLPYIVKHSGHSVSLLGLALAAQAASTGILSLVVGKWGRQIPLALSLCLLACILGLGVAVSGLPAIPSGVIVLGAMLVGAGLTFDVIEDTILQKWVPAEYLSRVYGAGMIAAYSLLPVGYAVAGGLQRVVGAGPVLEVGGSGLALAALLVVHFLVARFADLENSVQLSVPVPDSGSA